MVSHKTGQSQSALGEARLTASDHLHVLHMLLYSFQEVLFHCIPRHRLETHWLVFSHAFLSFLKVEAMVLFYQPPGTSLGSHDFSNIMDGLLVATSDSSLGPWDV